MSLLLSNFPPVWKKKEEEEIKKKKEGIVGRGNEKMNLFEESLERWNDENLDSRVG